MYIIINIISTYCTRPAIEGWTTLISAKVYLSTLAAVSHEVNLESVHMKICKGIKPDIYIKNYNGSINIFNIISRLAVFI